MYNYKDSKDYLLNLRPKVLILNLIIVMVFVFIIICCSLIKKYDIINSNGVIRNNELYIICDPSLTNNILKTSFLTIDDKKYSFIIKDVSDIMYNEYLKNYQEIKLDLNLDYNDIIVNVKLYQNKETILKKLYRLII